MIGQDGDAFEGSEPPPTSQRSAMMARVRGKNTAPEIAVRRMAHRMGLRFRLYRRDLPGTPDMVFPRHRVALFVHGCFWHRHAGCPRCTTPKTRRKFWAEKFRRNVERDQRAETDLRDSGWTVIAIWECQTRDAVALGERLASAFSNEVPPLRRAGSASHRLERPASPGRPMSETIKP